MKKVWLSLLSGSVIGFLISFFLFRGENMFFQFESRYPESVWTTEINIELAIAYSQIMFGTSLVIFLVWLLIERIKK